MTTETIKIQDHMPQAVLDRLLEDKKSCKKTTTAQLVAAVRAECFAIADRRVVSAPDTIQLEQRLEILEAIANRLEQRLSVLELDQLARRLPIKPTLPDTRFLSLEIPKSLPPTAVISSPSHAEASKAAQAEPADKRFTDPELPLSTLSTEVWRRGLTTNQLMARLQTNPTTLKKYLRDVKQVQWAVKRDPEGLGWFYHSPLQCYYPLQVESDGDLLSQSTPAPTGDIEALEETEQHAVVPQHELNFVRQRQLVETGGLYQSELASLTGIPINTLQRWKHLPDCAERIRCRTEGRHCYWYAMQTKRFYPLNSPTDHSFGVVTATEI